MSAGGRRREFTFSRAARARTEQGQAGRGHLFGSAADLPDLQAAIRPFNCLLHLLEGAHLDLAHALARNPEVQAP
jgi:hypothetical protein